MKSFFLAIWNNRWFAQIFRTNMGRLVFSFMWASAWMGVYNNVESEWPFWVAMVGIVHILVLFLIMMAYAWVINPLRDYRERKNRKP